MYLPYDGIREAQRIEARSVASTQERDRPRRYIVIQEATNQIVATCGGTHKFMERVIERLEKRHSQSYMYDDASQAHEYIAQNGPNISIY